MEGPPDRGGQAQDDGDQVRLLKVRELCPSGVRVSNPAERPLAGYIPWREMTGMRNAVVHEHGAIVTLPPGFCGAYHRPRASVWVATPEAAGHEQSGRRPWLVVSPAAYNGRVGLALLCPLTGSVKGYPFEVPVPEGLPVAGVVLCDQVKSLDWRARWAEPACALPADVAGAVPARLGTLVAP